MMKAKPYFLIVFVAAFIVLCLGCSNQRPRGELISSVAAPDGNHIMHIYRNDGGATVDWSTTVSIFNVNTKEERNIYFHYHEETPDEAVWVDPETVRINGMELNIVRDYYESFDLKQTGTT